MKLAAKRSGVAARAFAAGLVVDGVWARLVRGFRLQRADYPRMVIGGWRIHHNVVGWLAVAVGVLRYPLVLVPFGVGMIVGHRMRDRLFWFIERAE